MRNRSIKAGVVLAAAITALAALAAGSVGSAATKQGTFQAAFVTDTNGLNDKSFNHLGNIGRLKAQKDLRIQTKVYVSATEADYLPNAVAASQWGAKAVVMNGFLLADATNTAAKQFPDMKWAITDFPRVALADQPANAYGLTFKSEQSGFLVGYLAAEMAKAKIGPFGKTKGKLVLGAVGGKKIPSVDNWIAGYQRGAKAVDKRFKVLDRLLGRLPQLGRPEVQGARAQAHLAGLAGGVPGRRRLRPRCAAGREAEEGLGHRRRRRPGVPRLAHPDERREAGRHGRLHVLQAREGRQARRWQGPRLQPEEQGPGRRQDQQARPGGFHREDERAEGAHHQGQDQASGDALGSSRASSRGGRVGAPLVFARRRIAPAWPPLRPSWNCAASRSASRGSSRTTASTWTSDAGEVHALLGENGAGKSTLMNVVYGIYKPDEGEILVKGEPVTMHSAQDAIQHGIGMVHQHFMLIPVMTVAENIVLGDRAQHGGDLPRPRLRGPARPRAGAELRLRDRSGLAGAGHHGRPAAARRDPEGALPARRHPHPRRAHGGADAAGGERPLRDPADADARGHVGHLHQPQAARGARDRRPDQRAAARKARRTPCRGRERPSRASPADGRARGRAAASTRTPASRARRCSRSRSSRWRTTAVSRRCAASASTVRAGEIVGIAGVDGQRPDRARRGADRARARPSGGRVTLAGSEMTKGERAGPARGRLGHIPEDRLRRGIILDFSLAENLRCTTTGTSPTPISAGCGRAG